MEMLQSWLNYLSESCTGTVTKQLSAGKLPLIPLHLLCIYWVQDSHRPSLHVVTSLFSICEVHQVNQFPWVCSSLVLTENFIWVGQVLACLYDLLKIHCEMVSNPSPTYTPCVFSGCYINNNGMPITVNSIEISNCKIYLKYIKQCTTDISNQNLCKGWITSTCLIPWKEHWQAKDL